MHAEANGWYWLAGAMGGAGERFHGGNNASRKTADDCLRIFAKHCRITLAEAEEIRRAVRVAALTAGGQWAEGRIRWSEIMEAMRPRWKAEAEACVAHHELRVYGDPWPTPEPGIPVHAEPGSLAGRILGELALGECPECQHLPHVGRCPGFANCGCSRIPEED